MSLGKESTLVSSSLACVYQACVEEVDNSKNPLLLQYGQNCCRKFFIVLAPSVRGGIHQTSFFNLTIILRCLHYKKLTLRVMTTYSIGPPNQGNDRVKFVTSFENSNTESLFVLRSMQGTLSEGKGSVQLISL